ncbi:PB1 domain protein (macronuclear) [Tetrahymena thermophila SB210]|uniref:PB1 domain protein n=1 Tax=Tetrahymena thermophila (strain SB210) TaxID=312017 RepID=I7M6G0_TETTS|nr:PB1 domain protein [Tetrahymena thermophila SB210]EAR85136.2 PB1 domain protein [Tetrahymena thermophila SB210]|eukprot:XP_001032799.2 PB1 domain protein [Tetrahymena thermophila SB210]
MFPQFQEHQQNRISLKLVFGGDCFRLSKFPQNFQELEDIARNKFDNKLPENFCFKYQDSENDSINVESSSDYEAFLEYCNQEKLKAIKLRIDSKSFKQYFNWQEQQQQAMGNQPNFANQGQSSQTYQANNVIGMLLNPFTPYYQNMQNKNQKTQFQISSQDQNSFYGNFQNMNSPNSNDLNYNIIQMLMCMLNTQGNQAQKSSSTTNSCLNNHGFNNGNNNVNVNFNNNTNAVNNSLSSAPQIPSLSRGASEANANDIKRQSANQSYTANVESNISFANERRNVGQSLSQQQNNQQNIMVSFANVKSSVTKNAIATSNQMNQYNLLMQQPFNSSNINDLNITSKFGNQDLTKFENEKLSNTRNLISGSDIPNPMIDESDNDIKSKDIKKISSMSCGLDDMQPTLSNHLSFTPGSQNIFNNSQNINLAAKNSQYLKQAELNSSTISNNVDTRSQTTGGGNMGSNYSANNVNQIQAPQGIRINEALLSSQYTNQAIVSREQFDQIGKESIQNQQFDKTIESDFIANNYIKREFSPSPPLSQNNTLANSTNNLMQSKIRPSQITPPLRSGQSIQVPCEKCMIWDEEQKNNPSRYSDKTDKTPTSSIGKDIIPFTPCPECDKCGGSGFLKIEDPNTFNVIQTIVRHKLKEAEIVLKSLTVRQQKVEKIIPKESMDWLQKILQIQCGECASNRPSQKPEDQPLFSPFTPSQSNKDKDLSLQVNNNTNLIQKNMHLIRCSECQTDVSQLKFIYFCIDCKSKNNRNSEVFSKRWQDDIDFDNIICENCEDNHDSNHRVVQFCKDDIMIMHSNLNQQTQQNQQSLTSTPIQRTSQLDRSIKAGNSTQQNALQNLNYLNNNMTNPLFQNSLIRKPERNNFTQSTNLFTFPQQNNVQQIQKALQGQLETSTYIGFQPQSIQLQQQQSIIQTQLSAQARQEFSQRNSVDTELLQQQQQNLHKMRSKSDNKSVTTIVKNTSHEDQFDYFNDNLAKDDANINVVLPRCSTNQKIIKKPISGNTSLNVLSLNNQEISCVTANFNQDDEPPTFCDSSIFKVPKNIADSNGAPSSANIISSPVVSQHPLVSNTTQQQTDQINFEIIPPTQKNEIQLISESSSSKKQKVNIFENIQNQESPEQSQNLLNSKLNNTNDFTLEEPKSNVNQTQSASSSSSNISNSICVKSQYTSGKSLTQSVYGLSSSRPSITPSGQKQGEDQRQYRAKLVNSYCSSDILIDDSVIVFQEILNNGTENWPENVYLKCISGITDNCQYPVVQVNKGEVMSIAFPIKINQNQAADGEQIKTAWRLYHQQQNEERKFFGPKITIDFQYKKPKKIELEQSLEFLIESTVETIKNIFNKDSKSDINEFVKQNQQIAQSFLQDNKEDRMISKLIIKYIELYVTFKNNKSAQEKLQDF